MKKKRVIAGILEFWQWGASRYGRLLLITTTQQ